MAGKPPKTPQKYTTHQQRSSAVCKLYYHCGCICFQLNQPCGLLPNSCKDINAVWPPDTPCGRYLLIIIFSFRHCSTSDAGATTFGHEPLGNRVAYLCDKLASLARTVPVDGSLDNDPRQDIPVDTRQYLIDWLSSDPRVRLLFKMQTAVTQPFSAIHTVMPAQAMIIAGHIPLSHCLNLVNYNNYAWKPLVCIKHVSVSYSW